MRVRWYFQFLKPTNQWSIEHWFYFLEREEEEDDIVMANLNRPHFQSFSLEEI